MEGADTLVALGPPIRVCWVMEVKGPRTRRKRHGGGRVRHVDSWKEDNFAKERTRYTQLLLETQDSISIFSFPLRHVYMTQRIT